MPKVQETFLLLHRKNNRKYKTLFNLMKKIAIRVSAALVALSAIMVSCNNKETNSRASQNQQATPSENVTDSTGVRPSVLAAYIRYVDTQRILSEYTLAREVAKTDSAAQIQLAALQNQLGNNLSSRAQQIQEKYQRGGYINESAYQADVASYNKAQQDAENRIAQRQRDYATDMMNKQVELHDSIKSVVDAICRKQNLDAILSDQAGLYFNPSLDITDEVIAELNRRYKTAK